MAHLYRATLRDQLRTAQAMRGAQVVEEQWSQWQNDLRERAGD